MTSAILCGDALATLRTLPDDSVHCCVTSPPYWGLRDYGVSGQLGLEPTLTEFLAGMVAVFDEVRRVLRKDGTLWLNMGDSYASSSLSNRGRGVRSPRRNGRGNLQGPRNVEQCERRPPPDGIKAKDLIGQPWRLAFALQETGWYLRSDIIWHKTNPMPEAIYDRPTRCHEYLFLLSKSRKYHYDHKAISEELSGGAHSRGKGLNPKSAGPTPSGWARPGENRLAVQMNRHLGRSKQNPSMSSALSDKHWERRNKRTVWTLPTKPFRGAHFATFPPKLVEPCILAGCPRGGMVLDPFAGSGTTGMVAVQHGRDFVGIELNPTYAEMARKRIAAADPGGRQQTIGEIAG